MMACPVVASTTSKFEMQRSKEKDTIMKIVVIGGTGLIGSKLVTKLREHGNEAVAASPSSGVNTLTGEGLAEVLKGASVVVDVTKFTFWDAYLVEAHLLADHVNRLIPHDRFESIKWHFPVVLHFLVKHLERVVHRFLRSMKIFGNLGRIGEHRLVVGLIAVIE